MEDSGAPTLRLGLFRLGQGLPGPLDLGPEEEARLRGIGAPLRAAQYLAGRWLLRRLCALALGPTAGGPMRLNAEGRPAPKDSAGKPLPCFLSLAHSGDWILGAACPGAGPCGVDIERRGARRDWPGLARHLGAPGAASEDAVLRAWTLREARIKAGATQGLALWRLESPAYLGCLVAPPGQGVDLLLFGEGHPGHRLEPEFSPVEEPRPC